MDKTNDNKLLNIPSVTEELLTEATQELYEDLSASHSLNEDIELFKKIVKDMLELFEKKNANYGNSFEKLYKELGPIAGLVPLHNKLDRATNLIKGAKNDFESLEDTFMDLANYAIMNLIEMYKEHPEPKKIRKQLNEYMLIEELLN